MAAPTVRGRTAPGTGLSVTSPAGTAVGDLVLIFTWETRANATNAVHTIVATYTQIGNSANYTETGESGTLSVGYKVATSSGANSYAAFTSNVGTSVTTGCIVLTVGTFNVNQLVNTTATSTTNGAPDAPSATLGTSRDWLAVAVGGWCFSSAATTTVGFPANYSNGQATSGSVLMCLATCERALTAPASENPATFTDNTVPTGTAAATVGIGGVIDQNMGVFAVSATATDTIAASTRGVSAGVLAISATAVDTIAASTRETTAGPLVLSATATDTVAGASRGVLTGALAMTAMAQDVVAGASREAITGALAVSAAGAATVAASTRETFGTIGIAANPVLSVAGASRNAITGSLHLVASAGDVIAAAVRETFTDADIMAMAEVLVADASTGGADEIGPLELEATGILAIADIVREILAGQFSLGAMAGISVAGATVSERTFHWAQGTGGEFVQHAGSTWSSGEDGEFPASSGDSWSQSGSEEW